MAYNIVQLNDMIDELGEEKCRHILSQYSCPPNLDVEHFLTKRAAIDFAKQGITRTYLVFSPINGVEKIAGYFAIAAKAITVEPNKLNLSNSLKKRIKKFGQYDSLLKRYYISAPLLAQLGKNYADQCDKLITGDELLHLALEKVGQAQALIGGRFVYLECEPQESLIDFYKRHGFCEFARRDLDADEVMFYENKCLVQMLKYLGK